ncbi:hypothetical protein BpHYR1_049515 [Brachionus plicatilis]|uniref:Uncharacterized protein n=1 Tax=Brachionus plicatilis TaxID=10195 RepID=A0A3M7R0E1_BRAPC|nr:hypothetical protein BpHYR1_049515 [Brachionus plicatilis]
MSGRIIPIEYIQPATIKAINLDTFSINRRWQLKQPNRTHRQEHETNTDNTFMLIDLKFREIIQIIFLSFKKQSNCNIFLLKFKSVKKIDSFYNLYQIKSTHGNSVDSIDENYSYQNKEALTISPISYLRRQVSLSLRQANVRMIIV